MSETRLIRVMIVDDHAVVRGGLSKFLQVHKDLELVGEAENGLEAVRLAKQLQPDVVLMDLKMPEMDGVAATRELRAQHPKLRVIVLTSFAEDNMVQGALQAGATGYLLKNVTGADLANAIRAAHAGRITLSSEATEALVHAVANPIVPADELTEREREVLDCVAAGLSNKEVGARLHLSEKTVKHYMTIVMEKLGVRNRTEAALLVEKMGQARTV